MLTIEKDRPALQCQADLKKNIFTESIPQNAASKHLAITMDPTETKLGIDSYIGNIRSFRSYLKAQRIFLVTGIIV